MLRILFHRQQVERFVPVAVGFKLRKFKCKIAQEKKMKVKLIADILTLSFCDENHRKDVA